jgi:methionyl-tRNA synthetase
LSMFSLRKFSQRLVVITSPIFYVNAKPHIGHLYTALHCDAMARSHRLAGDHVFFATGTDEHGLKIQKRALEEGKNLQAFCDHYSEEFKRLFAAADISYDRFVRTTEQDHQRAVEAFWKLLRQNGCIEEGKHHGYYSVNEESFISEKDLVKDGEGGYRTEAGERVELIEEKNYVFSITQQMRDQIREWVKTPTGPITPETIANKILSELESRKAEISVSRPTDRIHWGIRVPGDPNQTIYVWLDALVNYLTVIGYPNKMSPDISSANFIHVIGKDIAKFHCVYWPAFLAGAGMPFPK